jgi:vancomycin permeability regulator SanA
MPNTTMATSIIDNSKQLARRTFTKVWRIVRQHPRLTVAALLAIILLPVALMAVAYAVIEPYDKYVLQGDSQVRSKHIRVGMVLGAGVTKSGKPYRELQARLDSAASALQHGDVQKLILSGDNRFKNYDEPTAMKNYLVNVKHIAASKLQPDFAGRSTYESCQRAAEIFSQKQLVLYSTASHLPRAIYLCRHFGIETYGVASGVEANNASRREAEARVKALYNVYLKGENTILGTPIHM